MGDLGEAQGRSRSHRFARPGDERLLDEAPPISEVELTFTREFKEDVEAQVDWLEDEHPSWNPKLERGLSEAFELLADFPRAGSAAPTRPIRKLVLHRLPFVIWYSFDENMGRVASLRLFHARQRRPRAH